MKIRVPYLTTTVGTDLTVTFLLTPLWWVLGVNALIYQAVALLLFLRVLAEAVRRDETLYLPKASLAFAVFLISYLFSILINMGAHPFQRFLASLNNYAVYVMGFLLILVLYNHPASVLGPLLRASRILCVLSGGISIVLLFLWAQGYRRWDTVSLLARWFPGFLDYPFFYALMTVRLTYEDWLMSATIPRLSLYSAIHTATGGFMLILLPLTIACYRMQPKRGLTFYPVILLGLIPLVFSLSRSAMCSFVASFVLVTAVEKRRKIYFSLVFSVFAFMLSGLIYNFSLWLLKVRDTSTRLRMTSYLEAVHAVVDQNLLLGLGVKLREGFTMAAVGSHSTWVSVFLVGGLVAFVLFLLFQFSVFMVWLRQQDRCVKSGNEVLWRYLGISYLAVSIWLITDSIDALPFVAYAYFLIIGGILWMNRESHVLPSR